MKSTLRGMVLLGTLCVASSGWAGPLSKYFLTAGDESTNWIAQGGTATSFAQAHPSPDLGGGEYAIAVSASVKTLGNGNCAGSNCNLGAQYTLAGVYTGTDYIYPPVQAGFYDGASDGTNNYSVDYTNGGVYRFDGNWANPVLLFSTAALADLGITFDSNDGTLWVSQFGGSGGEVQHYTLGGALLGQFATTVADMTALAFDPADGTLWMGSQQALGTFYQYSTAGVQLSSISYGNMNNQNTLGGEFAIAGNNVPEPASLALLGVGLAGLGFSRRKVA